MLQFVFQAARRVVVVYRKHPCAQRYWNYPNTGSPQTQPATSGQVGVLVLTPASNAQGYPKPPHSRLIG